MTKCACLQPKLSKKNAFFFNRKPKVQKPLTKYSTRMTLTYNVSENEAMKLIPFDDALTKKTYNTIFFL